MKIRLAELNDSLDILRWRNDSITRAMSRNEDVIDVNAHNQWFEKLLLSPSRLLLVGVVSDKAVGMVRFDHLQNTERWEISITLAPEYRGKGLSKHLLELALAYFTFQFSQAELLAEIKRHNLASRKLFEGLGFNVISNEGDMLHYSYERHVQIKDEVE